MTEFKDIIDFMNSFCPPHLAFNGDNVGLIVGTSQKEVKKILLSLDVDETVANEAAALGADAIISHHPLMFHPVKRLTDNDPMQRTIAKLVKEDIPLFSAHTNLDCVRGGLNDFLAGKLGLENTCVIDVVDTFNGEEHGFGRLGTVKKGTRLCDMLSLCTEALGTDFVKYIGDPQKEINRVAVNCGAGADLIDYCIAEKVDLFITGDVKYNPARDCLESQLALIDAGHYETEHIVCELLEEILSKEFPCVEFICSGENKAVFSCYHK